MLPLASAVAPGAPVLSPRGAVREGAANRWFRRFAEGVFDLDDLRRRAADLAAWVAAARETYRDGLAGRKLVALGYSNGANIAAATLLAGHHGVADAAVLLRAQHTLDAAPGLDLRGLPVLLLSGAADPVVPAAGSRAPRRGVAGRRRRRDARNHPGRARPRSRGTSRRRGASSPISPPASTAPEQGA